jgi:hypothetical protein
MFLLVFIIVFFWFQFKFHVNTFLFFIAYAFIVCVSALDIGACKLYFVKKITCWFSSIAHLWLLAAY